MLHHAKFLGIEIGGTKLQMVRADAAGTIEKRLRWVVDTTAGADGICTQIEKGFQQLNTANDLSAIGVGFGGPVDPATGIIRVSHQVKGWSGFHLAQWLHCKSGVPVAVENDANTAALAEALLGAGKAYRSVFYMTIGSGIGGGMVIDKKLYHGRQPGEVEVGHLRMSKKGETLEDRCSGWAVNKKVKAAISQEPTGWLARLAGQQQDGHEAKLLQAALERKDKTAQHILEETADDLAFALSHVVHLFHPDILILGGGLSLLKEHLLQPITEKLPHYVMKAFHPVPPLSLAALGENVVPIGALELAKQIFQKEQFAQTI